MKAIDRLLPRLSRVRQVGNDRWIARCPAHDDHRPSLSLKQAGDFVLLKCWAGCPAETITSALGLMLADLYDARRRTVASRRDPAAERTVRAAEVLRCWRGAETQRLGEELRDRDRLVRSVDEAVNAGKLSECAAWSYLGFAYHNYSALESRWHILLDDHEYPDTLELWRESQVAS